MSMKNINEESKLEEGLNTSRKMPKKIDYYKIFLFTILFLNSFRRSYLKFKKNQFTFRQLNVI